MTLLAISDNQELGFLFISFAAVCGMLFGLWLWLLPFWIARKREHPNAVPILILSLFGGPTGILWILALAWSLAALPEKKHDSTTRFSEEDGIRERPRLSLGSRSRYRT